MAGTITEAAPRLIHFQEDLQDVSGNGETFGRTAAVWEAYTRDPEACELAGRMVVRDILAHDGDTEPGEALTMASEIAIQHPPLLGQRLLSFLTAAEQAINQRNEVR